MSYYPPPPQNQQPGFYPPPVQNQPGYPPAPYGDGGYQPGAPGPYGPPPTGQYAPPGPYVPPGQYAPPGQYPPPGQYAPAGSPGYGGGVPIVNQPGPQNMADWMPLQPGPPNCPPGLAYLTSVSSLFVKQKVELLEAFTGFETSNKYTIKNAEGQKVFFAAEDSDCCTRNCCGPNRPFDMKILDAYKNEVIHLNRPLACSSCCFPCCLQTMEVSSPPGTVVGTIEQEWSLLTPQFVVKDSVGETVLRIEGPFCTYSICGNVEFKILSKDGQFEVGKISKQWSGFIREMLTDADYFGVSFPVDLDVRMKAVMIGAVFLIDAMFFEKSRNQESDGIGML